MVFVLICSKDYIMKSKLSLMAFTVGGFLLINACKSPEDRASADMMNDTAAIHENTGTTPADTMTAMTGARPDTASVAPGATSGNTSIKKGTKGKASVSMSDVDNSKDKMQMDKNGVYAKAEVMPSFPGGQNALEKYVEDNLQYPQQALDNGTEGRVLIEFDVDEKGKLYHPVIVSDKIGDGLDEEALRVVKGMPTWTPGQMKGKNVKTKFTLPISYQIY